MPVSIPTESKEFLKTVVTADVSLGGIPEFAFPALGARPATWVAGTWSTPAVVLGDGRFQRTARTPLIGDLTGIVLPAGLYSAFIRVTDSPEVPVERFDTLTVV